MLSKIERGVASPTIGLLGKITVALGIPLTRLVAEPEVLRRRVIRREELRPLADPVNGVVRTSVSTEVTDWGLELVRYEMPPGSVTGECGWCCRGIREIFHVVAGEILIEAAGATDGVRAGETLLRESDGVNYNILNPSSQPATFYLVIDRRSART